MNKGDLELITASHLAQWPETKSLDAQPHFPELVRRLLIETPEASEISIPIKEGITKRGYDGKATIKEPTKLLPAGHLRFELGTDKDINRKVDKDYVKRNEKASAHEIFVFITPRRWPNKEDWITKQQNDSNFDRVTALDADDLELWLQLAPNTHVWISEWLGYNPRDAVTLEKWWNDFKRSTSPELPLGLFTAGRDKEAEQLRQLVKGEPQLIRIRSEWEDDALGFFAATFAEQFEADFGYTLTTIIRSAEVWERVTAQRGNGTLVPLFDRPDIDRAIHSGRHVVEVLNSNTARREKNADIKLPRLKSHDLYNLVFIFHSEGVEWQQAEYLARLAILSLPELMREISLSSPDPSWLKPPLAKTLAALTLAGSWDENDSRDLELISKLAGTSPDSNELEDFIFEVAQGHDPAIRKIGKVNVLVSPKQVLYSLGKVIPSGLASRWADISSRILLESTPTERLTVSPEIITQEGKQRACSPSLRKGLANSLALVGSIEPLGDDTSNISSLTNTAKKIVCNALTQAISDEDGHTWLGIADILPSLAEAAPDIFLSKVEDDLASDKPSVVQLLQTANDLLGSDFPSSRHPLLEALQTLCWLPESSIEAVKSLTSLAKVAAKLPQDNSLIKSILEILYSWFRNVDANQETRLKAIKACHSIDALFSFKLITRLCTDTNSIKIPLNEPRYQLQKFNHKEVQQSEWSAFISRIMNITITWAEKDHSVLPWLFEAITNGSPENVSTEDLNSFINLLDAKISSDDLEEDICISIFEKGQDFAIKYKRFQDAELKVHKAQYARIIELVSSLELSDDPRRFTNLFGRNPELPDFNSPNYKDYYSFLEEKQHNAFDVIFTQPDGWNQLVIVTKRAEHPGAIGYALATYKKRSDIIDTMLEWLKSESNQMQEAATTWANRHLRTNGSTALHHILERRDFTERSRKLFILSIPTESEFWDVLHDFPRDKEIFWEEAYFMPTTEEDRIQAIEILLQRDRAWAAMDIAEGLALKIADNQVHKKERDKGDEISYSKLFTSVLWKAIKQYSDLHELPNSIDSASVLESYKSGACRLLDYLEKKGTSIFEMADLELAYLSFLLEVREPRALYQVLISNPKLFADLVRLVHQDKQEPLGWDDRAELEFKNASLVLREWPGFPVKKEDGKLDEETIGDWIKQVRKQLHDRKCANCGDFLIGKAFAKIPFDLDGIWPPEFIRDLIEEIDSEHLDKGIYSVFESIEYSRCRDSATSANIFRKSVEAVQAEWPRTAHILRRIADFYKEEARRQNEEAEISQVFHYQRSAPSHSTPPQG